MLLYLFFFVRYNVVSVFFFPESTSVFEDRENLNDFLEEAELQQYYELFR